MAPWRHGGFQEWLTRWEMWNNYRDVDHFSRDAMHERDDVPADSVATFLAIHFGALISKWDGEADEKFEARTRVLDRISRSVVRLQRSTHRAKEENEEFIRGLEEKYQKVQEYCKQKRLDMIWSMKRRPLLAEQFGGGRMGDKIAKYIIKVENDVPGAKLEITKEDLKREKRPSSRAKPAKPAGKRRTAKPARKTRVRKAAKPLQENELEPEMEDQTTLDQPAGRSYSGEGGSSPDKAGTANLASVGEGPDEEANAVHRVEDVHPEPQTSSILQQLTQKGNSTTDFTDNTDE
jgi:hypothetical protein